MRHSFRGPRPPVADWYLFISLLFHHSFFLFFSLVSFLICSCFFLRCCCHPSKSFRLYAVGTLRVGYVSGSTTRQNLHSEVYQQLIEPRSYANEWCLASTKKENIAAQRLWGQTVYKHSHKPTAPCYTSYPCAVKLVTPRQLLITLWPVVPIFFDLHWRPGWR